MKGSLFLVAAALALVAAMVLGVSFGGSASLADLLRPGTSAHDIVVAYRLPRVLLGAVAGGGLAAVGSAFQAVLRNPLAEPYILGVSGGAALGATLATVAGLGGATLLGAAGAPAAAFAGGIGATAIVWTLVRQGRGGGASILLAGVVVNSIAGACITILEAIARPGEIRSLLWWLMGFLDQPLWWTQLGFIAAYVAAGLIVLLADAARMNVLALGDEPAMALGVDVRALERRVFFASAAVVGAIVSVTGLIGFVGLVVPQGVRRCVGPDLRFVLPGSALAGGATLVGCDLLVRLLSRHVLHEEVPVGAVTAIVGGPVFLLLMRRTLTP